MGIPTVEATHIGGWMLSTERSDTELPSLSRDEGSGHTISWLLFMQRRFSPEKQIEREIGEPGPKCRGLDGSNPLRSASQSAVFAFSAENSKIVRMFAEFVRLKGTGESQFRPATADSCSILSVENRAGALHTSICQKNAFAKSSPFQHSARLYDTLQRIKIICRTTVIVAALALGSRKAVYRLPFLERE